MSSVSSVSSIESVESIDTNLSVSSISFSDEDSEEPVCKKTRAPRVFLDRVNLVDSYSEQDFKQNFGLSKYAVYHIINLIEEDLKFFTCRNKPISALNQFLIALKYFTSCSRQVDIADTFQVSKSTVGRLVRKVSDALIALADEYIKMPETIKETNKICEEFKNISRFQNVCGIVDCLNVQILPPPNPEVYRNESGSCSINVQIICDANLRIRDVELLKPGSVQNNTIFNDSQIKNRLEGNEFGETYLLGNNAYQSQNYLLTPVTNPTTAAELRYNEAHEKTRNKIEVTFELLTNRFSRLLSILRITLDKIYSVILAICILHNICLDLNEPILENNENYYQPPKMKSLIDNVALLGTRNKVINDYFSN